MLAQHAHSTHSLQHPHPEPQTLNLAFATLCFIQLLAYLNQGLTSCERVTLLLPCTTYETCQSPTTTSRRPGGEGWTLCPKAHLQEGTPAQGHVLQGRVSRVPPGCKLVLGQLLGFGPQQRLVRQPEARPHLHLEGTLESLFFSCAGHLCIIWSLEALRMP